MTEPNGSIGNVNSISGNIPPDRCESVQSIVIWIHLFVWTVGQEAPDIWSRTVLDSGLPNGAIPLRRLAQGVPRAICLDKQGAQHRAACKGGVF